MSKKSGIIFVVAGAVLIASALLLFLYNDYTQRRAGQNAELLMEDLHSVLEENTDFSQPDTTEATPEDMPVITIDGYEYIGYISVPELSLELPVMSDWDYTRLKIAPCRHFGSLYEDNIVIAAHNYKRHFKYISRLEPGAQVIFTDVNGRANIYSLVSSAILSDDAVDAVQNSGYDLVLYTCTPGGSARTVLFCNRSLT